MARRPSRTRHRLLIAFLGTVFLSSVIAGGAARAQSTSSSEQRRAAITRIIDGINSPDPATRVSTLDAATQSKDPVIRHIALSTAFANADTTVRMVALVDAFATAPSFVVQLVAGEKDHLNLARVSQGRFVLRPSHFNRSTNTFTVSTNYSALDQDNHPAQGPGEISGDRVSFSPPINKGFSPPYECQAVTQLEPTGSTLQGTLSCPGLNEHYTIKIDLLR